MQVFRHYSFDLWLTLIRSNPAFKQQRALYFHQKYNYLQKSVQEVETIFRQVDLMCNSMNEKTGKNIDADEMYLMVISMINNYEPSFRQVDLAELEKDMEAMIFNYLPVLYSSLTIIHLERLIGPCYATLSLLSNTGFIRGAILRKIMVALDLDRLLSFQLYSDEERMSKPNPKFFQLMLDKIDRRNLNFGLDEIVHVGDNPIADVQGAEALGITAVLVNSNHLTLACL